MNADPTFVPLRPRRLASAECASEIAAPRKSEFDLAVPDRPLSDAAPSHSQNVEEPADRRGEMPRATSESPLRDEPQASTRDQQASPSDQGSACNLQLSTCGAEAQVCDPRELAAALRSEAARFAAIACARALRVALSENPATIARFVDDALRACGRIDRARVRLNPQDATAYRPHRDVEVTADQQLERGEVIVEAERGALAATLESRALLLTRAASDA